MSSEGSTQAEPGPFAQAPFTLQLQPAEPRSCRPKRYLWKAPSGIKGLKDELMPHGDEDGLHAYIFVNSQYEPTYPKGFRYMSNCPDETPGLGSLATKLSGFVAAHHEFLEEIPRLRYKNSRRHKLQEWMRENVKSASEQSIWLIEGSLRHIVGFKGDPRELFQQASKPSSLKDEPRPILGDSRGHEGPAGWANIGKSHWLPNNPSSQGPSTSRPAAGHQTQFSMLDKSASLFLGTYGADPFEQIPSGMWATAHDSVKQLPSRRRELDIEALSRVLRSLCSRQFQEFPTFNEGEFTTLGMTSPSHQAAFLKVRRRSDGELQTMPTTDPQGQRGQEHGSSVMRSASGQRELGSSSVQPFGRDAPGHAWVTQSATGHATGFRPRYDPSLFQGSHSRTDPSGPDESRNGSSDFSDRDTTSW